MKKMFWSPHEEMYVEIKKGLLSGIISPAEFRNRLIDLDQATLDRKNCIPNLELLKDDEVVAFIQSQPLEIQKNYFNFLSFTFFHVGQYYACEYNKQEKALEYFKNALNAFQKGDVDEDYRVEWGIYIQGTIAYLENNSQALKEQIKFLGESKNAGVLSGLMTGLQKRGSPNYNEDY